MKDDLVSKVRIDVLLEQKHKDGISHIVVGLYLMIIAILMSADRVNMAVIFVPMIPTVINRLKKRFTYPRIGYAEVKEKERIRYIAMLLIGVLLLLGLGAMLYFQTHSLSPVLQRSFHTIVILGIGVLLISMLAYKYFQEHSKTPLCYGVVILALIATIFLLKLSHDTVIEIIFVLGVLDFSVGLVLLQKFLKKYPVTKDDN